MTDKQKKKKLSKLKKTVIGLIQLYAIYIEKYQCSMYFKVTLFDIIKNNIKVQNKEVLHTIKNILETTPYNKKIEMDILNSIRH